MTERIHDFLRRRRDNGLDDGPCLVVDLDVVRDNYRAFAKALPDSRVFYAVKANPAPELLSLLVSLAVQRSAPKRLVHLAGRAERVFPLQSKAAVPAQEPRTLTVSPTHGRRQALYAVDAGRTRKNVGG